MGSIPVRRYTDEEARERRRGILEEVGGEDSFRARAAGYQLDAHELALFDELEDLDYLLSS